MGFPVTNSIEFPFGRAFSLAKLVEFWQEASSDESNILSAHATTLLAQLENRPDLLGVDIDRETLNKHADLLPYLLTPVIPLGGSEHRRAAIIPPFRLVPFYATESFKELDIESGYPDSFRVSGIDLTSDQFEAGKAVNAYAEILNRIADVSQTWFPPFIFTTQPDNAGLQRHFKMEFDTRFIDIKINGEPPEIRPEDIDRIQDDPMNLALWTEILPPEHFSFEGFSAINAIDVTIPEELSFLKDDLLRPGSMSSSADIDGLQQRLRMILRLPEIRLGLLTLERSTTGKVIGARPIGHSLLMSNDELPQCPNKEESLYMQAFESGEPIIVTDLESCEEACTGYEFHLMHSGFRSLVIAPLHFEDRLVGLLELASPNENDLNNWNVHNLLQVRSLFATALNREIESREDRIQSVVKRHYTAIHPAVEWRFRDAALTYLEAADGETRPEIEEVIFEDVYPLFGLSDIRGSSTHRVDSIRADLLTQLRLAMKVVESAAGAKPLPVLDELAYQIESHARDIESGLSSGDEITVLEFLRSEVEARLDHLATYSPDAAVAVESYRSSLDPKIGVVYQQRKAFDDSVHAINDRIASFLEAEQEHAQQMFPHYFERYLTDGVDYNIYIGASLVKDDSFDPIYLRNLRLWQLMATCGIYWELEDLKPELPMELDTAHLILAQSAPLSIRFRDDEKQFDVDGAYNARYEIVKKRIDKATVKPTGERLTQPGMIAIVYSQTREGEEYRRYFDYLQAAGFLTGTVEDFVLEDLQGVSGLRALRVQIATTSPEQDYEVTPIGTVEPVKVS